MSCGIQYYHKYEILKILIKKAYLFLSDTSPVILTKVYRLGGETDSAIR